MKNINKEIEDMFEILTEQWGDCDNLVNDLLIYSKKLQQENKQLKDNWNKLKEYIGKEWYSYDNDSIEFEISKDILKKIEELEKGDINEN